MQFKAFLFIYFIALCLLPQHLEAQDKKKVRRDLKNMSFYNAVVDKNDLSFEVATAPDEWKQESYVLLAVKTYLNVGSKNNLIRGINRKRILLQDQNAIELFTEFYFQDSETILITLTKKNGEEIEINTKEALVVSTEVPKIYASRFQSSQSYKLAISDLEIGDIIDFTSIYTQDIGNMISYSDVLNETEPILYQNIIIDINRKWDVYKNTFNTDSKFKLGKGKGHAFDGTPDDEMDRYSLISTKLEAKTENLWENVYEVEPIVKFLGIAPKHDLFYFGNESPEKNIDISSVLKVLRNECYRIASIYSTPILLITKEVKASVTKKDHTKAKVEACYYFLRKYRAENYYPHKTIQSVKGGRETYESLYGEFNSMDEAVFMSIFTAVLTKMGVSSHLVAILPNKIGSLSNALSVGEFYYGVYIPETDTYYWPPGKNSTHFDKPSGLMAGGIGKSIESNVLKFKNAGAIDKSINYVSPDFNQEINVLNFTLNTDDNSTIVKRTLTASGYHKINYKSLIEKFGDILYMDFLSMYNNKYIKNDLKNYERLVNMDKKGINDDFIQKSEKNLMEAYKSWLDEKDVETTILSYNIISTGRTSIKPDMIVEVEYKSDGLLKKLGPNLVFEIGKIIGSQIFIEEKTKANREINIDFGSPRQYEYIMEIDIPNGYFIENIEGLNKSSTNEYCTFISFATIEGDKLKVKSLKTYNKPVAPKSEWNRVVAVMDDAYKFSQEKIVLKKK